MPGDWLSCHSRRTGRDQSGEGRQNRWVVCTMSAPASKIFLCTGLAPQNPRDGPERHRTAQERFLYPIHTKRPVGPQKRLTGRSGELAWAIIKFPPHAWGCTFGTHGSHFANQVSPTRVGMYRLSLFQIFEKARFPHTRGDVLQNVYHGRQATVSPTRVGMYLIQGQAVFVPKFRISGRQTVRIMRPEHLQT